MALDITKLISSQDLASTVNLYLSIEKAEDLLKKFKKDKPIEKEEDGKVKTPADKCPICGKDIEDPTKSGMCSKVCEAKFKLAKVMGKANELKDKADDYLGKINEVAEYINELLDIATGIPNMLIDVAAYPIQEYVEYFTSRIQILELQIKKKINEVLIYKNKLLIQILETNKAGISGAADAVIGGALAGINAVIEVITTAMQAFDVAYQAAYNTIVNAMVPFMLQPESMSFFFTPRSLTKKPGVFVIPMSIINLNVSIADVLNLDTIESVIDIGFPPIKDLEYLMDPAAFKIRQAFSDQNAKGIYDLVSMMEIMLYTGAEPLPKYSKLKMSNPFFVIFLLTGWAPASIVCFGIPGFF